MKDLKEMDFTTLKNNFDEVCDGINSGSGTVTLTLGNGRSVYIMSEENYNSISRFVLVNISANTAKS